MITGRAVSALLLHHYRRVVVRRAVNYDFAGALAGNRPAAVATSGGRARRGLVGSDGVPVRAPRRVEFDLVKVEVYPQSHEPGAEAEVIVLEARHHVNPSLTFS